MPKPVFDIEQYELRNLVPEVYTPEQKDRLNATLARVNGQIDWTAQLLGFNGPNYWGLADRKADGTYNWKGLPETVNQKRRMQTGAFGVYGKDQDYSLWPAPFNRSKIAASADASFHLFERDGRTFASPWGQGELTDYMHDPCLFAGGYYIFDKEIEVTGLEIDVDNFVEYHTFKEINGTFTRLRILDDAIGGSLLIKEKGSVATAAPFEMTHWMDISDWSASTIRRQFIGMWGNKGNQLSMDFAFDALDLHGNDESYSLLRSKDPVSVTPEQLLKRVGLNSSFWTGFTNNPYTFTTEGCGDWAAVPPYTNGPLRGHPWKPQYVEDEVVILNCTENCDYDLTITQVLSEEDDYDNGEYNSFCSQTGIGYTDCQEIIKPIEDFLDNGTLELDPPASGRVEEGIYDRNPWRYIDRFDIRYTPKTERGLLLSSPCLEWKFDPDLDNGEFDIDNTPWGTAEDGVYDEFDQGSSIDGATNSGIACEPDVWSGYDDGVYGSPFIGDPCSSGYSGCEADNGVYSVVYGPPEFLSECDWQCPPIDNELYQDPEGAFLGPRTVDGMEMGYEQYLPPGCTYVEGGLYINWEPEEDCDCNVTCCEVDQGLIDSDRLSLTNKVDGQNYEFDYPVPEPSPLPPIPCAEYQPSLKICPAPDVRVNLSPLVESIPYLSAPNLRNSLVPLRTWKDRPMVIKDEVDTSNLEYWNYLTADTNKGLDVEGDFRHFVRLPLNYHREGREWNKATAVCNNQSYFSSPSKVQEMDSDPAQPRPLLYSESYNKKIDQSVVMYDEDYIFSSIGSDTEDVQAGFEDAAMTLDSSNYIEYNLAVTSSYDPFKVRTPYANGEWRGSYYSVGPVSKNLTGYLSSDLETYKLIRTDSPTYDESMIKRPNIDFVEENHQATAQNYVVSYAYFACDFSAANEPLFDPDKSQCWRKREIGSGKIDPDTVIPTGSLDSACVDDIYTTHTSYLLHPAT